MTTATIAAPARVLNSRDQAANFLGVSVRQIDTWIKQGAIQPTRLGRLVKIHHDELQRVASEGIAVL